MQKSAIAVCPPGLMIPARVYHLVEASNWPSVQRCGLLSTCELLKLTGVPPTIQERISTTQRIHLTALSDDVVIRDQLPMPPAEVPCRYDFCAVVCPAEPESLLLV